MPKTRSTPRLSYNLAGAEDAPALVFVNGLGGRLEAWFHQAKHFKADHRVLCFDNRGAGRSETSDAPATMATYAADVVRLMDEVGMETATLVGLSFGGRVVQELALGWPERVDRMVIGGTSCGGTAHVDGEETLRELFGMGHSPGEEEIFERIVPALFGPTYRSRFDKHLRVLSRAWSRFPPDPVGIDRQWEAYDAFDTESRLSDIRCPTLILHGTLDALSPVANAEFLAAHIRGARLVLLDDNGHSPNVESPARFNEELRGFLAAEQPGLPG
jgi:3-oxoadipate enol-lactonase